MTGRSRWAGELRQFHFSGKPGQSKRRPERTPQLRIQNSLHTRAALQPARQCR
jgi:hypothetical protein